MYAIPSRTRMHQTPRAMLIVCQARMHVIAFAYDPVGWSSSVVTFDDPMLTYHMMAGDDQDHVIRGERRRSNIMQTEASVLAYVLILYI